ncbi:MAG TPA: ParB/RepB/Spo0J family partition protein, partial [Candidatus Paceibacterota bacterium]
DIKTLYNCSMLGKGLESLIPQKGSSVSDSDNTDDASTDQLSGVSGGAILSDAKPEEEIIKTVKENSHLPVKPVDAFYKKGDAIFHIEIDKIRPNPHQPRKYFDEEALKDLASSIREFGVIQPIVVSKIEKESDTGTTVEYELIAGERRLMASKRAGLSSIPAIIKESSSSRVKLEMAVIENIQRADLSPIEKAKAFARLQDEFGLTQREIAVRLGKSREVVANAVRLLNLPTEVQEALAGGKIGESQARMLLSIEDILKQKEIFQSIIRDNLSVRDIKSKIQKIKLDKPIAIQNINPEIEYIREQLEELFGTKVDVKNDDGNSGKIMINFYSEEELRAITDKLLKTNKSNPEPSFTEDDNLSL